MQLLYKKCTKLENLRRDSLVEIYQKSIINCETKRSKTSNNLSFIYVKVIKRFEAETRVHIPTYSTLAKRHSVFFTTKDIPRIMLYNRSLNSIAVASDRYADSNATRSNKL